MAVRARTRGLATRARRLDGTGPQFLPDYRDLVYAEFVPARDSCATAK